MQAKISKAEYREVRRLGGKRVPKDKISYYRNLRCDVDDDGFVNTVPGPLEVDKSAASSQTGRPSA